MLPNRQIAKTTFEAGPEEKLAAVDVYGIKTEEVINTASLTNLDFLDQVKTSAAAEMRGGKSMLSKLPSVAKLGGASGLLGKAKEIGSKALSAVGGVNGLAKAVGPSLLARVGSGALSGVPGLANDTLSTLSSKLGGANLPGGVKQMLNSTIQSKLGTYANVNGVLSKVANTDVARAYNMSSVINSLGVGGTPLSIVDRDSTSRLISTLAIGGMQAGLPNVFGEVIGLAGGDKKIIASTAAQCMDFASKTGNLDGMKDIVLKAGKPAVASLGKQAMKSVAGTYSSIRDSFESPGEIARVDFTKTKDTFAAIDAKWAQEDRFKLNETTRLPELDYLVTDISIAREGNEDFRNMMQQGALTTTDPDLKYFAAATAFPVRSPEEELKRSFPLTHTSIETQTTQHVETVAQKDYVAPTGFIVPRNTVAEDSPPSENLSLNMEQLRERVKARRARQAAQDAEEEREYLAATTTIT